MQASCAAMAATLGRSSSGVGVGAGVKAFGEPGGDDEPGGEGEPGGDGEPGGEALAWCAPFAAFAAFSASEGVAPASRAAFFAASAISLAAGESLSSAFPHLRPLPHFGGGVDVACPMHANFATSASSCAAANLSCSTFKTPSATSAGLSLWKTVTFSASSEKPLMIS